MANFTPLTQDQYQSAIKAGFSPDQILQNEQKRKSEGGATPPTTGGLAGGFGSWMSSMKANAASGKNVIKDIFNFATGAEQGLGQDIATAINPAAAPGGVIPSTGKVLQDAAGTALDVATLGTYGAAAKGMQTGVRAVEAVAPTIVQKTMGVLGKDAAGIEKKILEMVSPKAMPVKGAKAIVEGKGVAPSLFGKGALDYSETPFVKKAADAVKGFIKNPGGSYIQAVNDVRAGISTISENLKSFLSGSMKPFNFADLRKSFELVKPSASLKTDPSAFKTYSHVRESMLQNIYNILKKSGEKGAITDWNEIWDARKGITEIADEQLKGKLFGTPEYTGVKVAARDMIANLKDFIINGLKYEGQGERVNQFTDFLQTARSKGIDIPNESAAIQLLKDQMGLKSTEMSDAAAAYFKDSMDRMSSMYDAITNMAPKAYQEVGKTSPEVWAAAHPTGAGMIKAAGIGAAGAIGAGGVYEAAKSVGAPVP